MKYMGDKDFWDEKFKSRGLKPLSPDQMLMDHLDLLKKGRVLDVACGDGRNSLYLLDNGFQVTGLDFSLEALNRLTGFSKAIKTFQRDLTSKSAFEGLGKFDSVVINHYRLSSDLIKKIPELLNKEGTLFVSGFSDIHKPDAKITLDDLIRLDDFKSVFDRMTLIKSVDSSDSRGCFVTYIFILND